MTTLVRFQRIICCAACCCVALACTRGEQANADARVAAADNAAAGADTTFAPRPEVVPAERIYYTLTQHEWYARGQPLLHEGRSYLPAGLPLAASLPEMEAVGEYQGVEYYRRQGEDEAVLYVPVYHGYWQQFRGEVAPPR